MYALLLLALTPNAGETSAALQGRELLQVPKGLTGEFTVAKTPPKVEITLFTDLPAGDRQTLWSSWGDGCLASDGRYYTAIGDHRGTDGNSHVYVYDPETRTLKLVVDVAKVIGQKPGAYGHGKIHSGIHEAADGWLYFATYWGKHREIDAAFTRGYNGGLLLRHDPKSGKTENLGAIVPKQGLPASVFDRERNLLYFFAVNKNDLAVYDLTKRKVIFLGGGDLAQGQRTLLMDLKGRVYFSGKGGKLHYYDPETNKLTATKAELPGGTALRAAARPTKSGLLYGMTHHGRLFLFDPKTETIKDLGPNFGKGDYTTVIVLSPDERYLYFAPGAHGSATRTGVPVVQYEIATGKRKVLAFLGEAVRQKLNYQVGGSYNLQIDSKGERLFITFNGAPVDEKARKQATFGHPSVVVLHVPGAERAK